MLSAAAQYTNAQAPVRPLIVGVASQTLLRINVDKATSSCNVEISGPGVSKVEKVVSPPNFDVTVDITPQQEGKLSIQWQR